MELKMRYSPAWVFSTSCSVILSRYVEGHLPIESYTNKISIGFNELYDDLTSTKLIEGVEEIMRFLALFEDENYLKIVNAFTFNECTFTQNGKKRKLKGIFNDGFSPQKGETSVDKNTKTFKAFFFKIRSNQELYPDPLWTFSQIKDFDQLTKILNCRVDIFDSL
jgi:hypothetical protein